MELKKGTTVKTFIPKVAEGVFTVICMFTDNDEYVLYYHSGKKTLRVFRTNDAQMIANYKMQAELTAIKSTKDGQSLVLGTVDGCLSVFSIADPEKPEMQDLLKQLPSRDVNVSDQRIFLQIFLDDFIFHQWKKKLAKIKATARFRAAYLTISLASKFNLPGGEEQEEASGGGEEKVETPVATTAPETPAE
jgi:NACHT domain- and WD repeat-containing protein